jgi:hypothetical protein
MDIAALRPLVGDLRQVASVRRIDLAEGPERGVSALAFSTGGGLDFWVLIERAMDIGPLWLAGRQIAWQSPAGFRHPALIDSEGDSAKGIERGFSGFLQTCGLEHTRGPVGGMPLHGRLPALPARLLSCGEDFDAAEAVLFAEGEVRQWHLNGENFRLSRRIEAPVGGRLLRIRDRVENLGPLPRRQASLYHVNLGFPAIRPGTVVSLGDTVAHGPLGPPDPAHPAAARCVALAGRRAEATVETPGFPDAPRVRISWSADTLPFLQTWSHERPGTYVMAVEPISSAMPPPGEAGADPALGPGETRSYRLEVAFEPGGG